MVSTCSVGFSNTDDHVDQVIEKCLNPYEPQSFFLYAGAGSGKTHSLVKALNSFEYKHGNTFRQNGKKLAVITYTNAACDEIKERVKGNSIFRISTIHSFCWTQINSFHDAIREHLKCSIPSEITELEEKEAKGRAGTKASLTRQRDIINKQERLEWLSKRREFTYSPNGESSGKASLSHSDVINIFSTFLVSKPSFQKVVISRYPFILIDESQDTNKALIEALFKIAGNKKSSFGLGLIGDMMQRIYGDGKNDLGRCIPDGWAKPVKEMNRRSPGRIVSLANDIRREVDGQEQKVLEDKPEGYVRLYIAPEDNTDKPAFENSVKQQMAEITGDALWCSSKDVKHLMLEHKMAAIRMGFSEMYEALNASPSFQSALKSGDLPATRLFSENIMRLYKLQKDNKNHALMTHLRKAKSPLLALEFLKSIADSNPLGPIQNAIKKVVSLIDSSPQITFSEVLQCVATNNLFTIPLSLTAFIEDKNPPNIEIQAEKRTEKEKNDGDQINSLLTFLETPYHQIEQYRAYTSGEGTFDTHQGVKGREFNRVQVVMDDYDAGGFLFSYEKLFEVKEPTKTDLEKIARGEDTGTDKTRRLFYVICTRAKKSLALIAYSQNPELLKNKAIAKGWFTEDEVILHF
jgi:DNA helicase-2/ATP-dependent DNA helicase PcrA